jgi:hypothetical protein
MEQFSNSKNDKKLQNPEILICAKCDELIKPIKMFEAVLRAAGILLITPIMLFIAPKIFGEGFISRNSIFIAIFIIVCIYFAVIIIRSALNRTCPKCGKGMLVRISENDRQRLLKVKD